MSQDRPENDKRWDDPLIGRNDRELYRNCVVLTIVVTIVGSLLTGLVNDAEWPLLLLVPVMVFITICVYFKSHP